MANEPILTPNLAGATFLQQAETGGILMTFARKTARQIIKVYNGAVGATTGKVFHDPSAAYDIKLITTGTAGLPAAAPGVAITLANPSTGNGVNGGDILVENTSLDHTAGQLREFSLTAEQMPNITSS